MVRVAGYPACQYLYAIEVTLATEQLDRKITVYILKVLDTLSRMSTKLRWITIAKRLPQDTRLVYTTRQCACGCGVRKIDLEHYDKDRDWWQPTNEMQHDSMTPEWPVIAWAECAVTPYKGKA
jgi:hypothetical protein